MNTNHSAGRTFDALGDQTRRDILELLSISSRGVREISDELPVTRSAVSQHLKVLKDVGLVEDVAQGTRRIYSVCPTGFDGLRSYLDQMWQTGLNSYAQAARDLAEQDRLHDTTTSTEEKDQ